MAVSVHIVVFWLMTSYIIISEYKRLGDTCCVHIQTCPWEWKQDVPLKLRYPPRQELYSVTIQKTTI
jgi:hypothetical protein